MKRYNCYYGYHEVWISEKELSRPLTFFGRCGSLKKAIAFAEKHNPDTPICLDESLREEYRNHIGDEFGFFDSEQLDSIMENTSFFHGESYDIRNGLSEITADNLRRKLDCRVSFADLDDIARFLHYRIKKPVRAIYDRLVGKTYGEIAPAIIKYQAL